MSTDTAVTTRTVSDARVQANRLNAQKSTGPRTEAGKARSRENGLKHGLAGSGVVLPEGMRAEVDRLVAAFSHDFRPQNEEERQIVERRALAVARSHAALSAETYFLVHASERAASPELWEADREAQA